MDELFSNLRYAVRMLWKSPGFTVVAIVALALGIGANTVIFSVVNAVLLKPLSIHDSQQVTSILVKDADTGALFTAYSYPNFEDIRDQNHVFQYVAAYTRSTSFLQKGDEPLRMTGIDVSAEIFPLLGVNPILGRTFSREEEYSNNGSLIVIGYDVWQGQFGGDKGIVGQSIPLDGKSVTVIGVMPRGFRFPFGGEQSEFWRPLAAEIPADQREARGAVYLGLIARLKPDVKIEQAQAEMGVIGKRLETQYPEANTGLLIALLPSQELLVRKVKPALLVLLAAVAFVLLIACANIANLLLARATVRRKEIAIRSALGASRWRVMRQLLTESVLLSLLGGSFGLLLALWGVDVLVATSPADLPRVSEIGLDKYVLLFTVGISTLTGILFGIAPAIQASKSDLNETLKDATRGMTGGLQRNRLRSMLVVSEIALSLILLVGAGLLIRSFSRLLGVTPGFEPNGLLTADVVAGQKKYATPAQQAQFFHQAIDEISRMPGVKAVGAVFPLPLAGGREVFTFDIGGRAPFPLDQQPVSDRRVASPDYFRAMEIPLVAGRVFNDQDRINTTPVAIINESFAHRYFADVNPVGQSILPGEGQSATPREIIGVVGDVHHTGLDSETTLEYYLPEQQQPERNLTFVLRTTSGDPMNLAKPLREVMKSLDREAPVYDLRPMNQLMDESVARRRFNTVLLGGLALLALVLASIGIYGVMSYSVAQRTREIGIRIALGAQVHDILALVLRQGVGLGVVGLGAGLGISLFATKLMSSLLFGVGATDFITFLSVAALLFAIVILACLIPARRAARVDPNIALRYE